MFYKQTNRQKKKDTKAPKPNEIFVLVQEGDVSARRANVIAAGSLGKVMHSLYFFLSVCLFVKHWAVVLN